MVENRAEKPYLARRDVQLTAGFMIAIVAIGFFGVPAFSKWVEEVTGVTARELEKKQAAEAAREAAAQALRADFEETVGVNLERLGEPPSYMVTLRESAKLAPSEAEHWALVIARVKRESGCPSIGAILHFPSEGSPPFLFPRDYKPELWLVTTNCP